MVHRWASTPRLDPPYAVRRLAELTGVELAVEGPCRGGEVGAAYVRWPDGRRSVSTGGTPTVAPLVELARAAGLPVARYELAGWWTSSKIVTARSRYCCPSSVVSWWVQPCR
jgi:hypothetical protein